MLFVPGVAGFNVCTCAFISHQRLLCMSKAGTASSDHGVMHASTPAEQPKLTELQRRLEFQGAL